MAAGLTLVALALPPAQAAPFVVDLSATVAAPLPIADLQARGGGSGPVEACRTSYFQPDAAERRFAFTEGSDDDGCLAVVYAFRVPPGIRRIGLDFQADRVLQESSRTLAVSPPAFEQEVRLHAGDSLVAAVPYFDPGQDVAPQKPVTVRFDVPPGAQDVEVEWWFANGEPTAASDASASRLQAWGATVTDPRLVLEEVPLPSPPVREHRGRFQGGSYITGFTAELRVPPDMQAGSGGPSLALHARMPGSALVDRVTTPDGTDLLDDEFETELTGSTRRVTIPEETIARLGPGPYELRFQGTEPVRAEPSMAALAGMALVMPAVAIFFAARQLRRRSVDTHLQVTDDLEGELAPR